MLSTESPDLTQLDGHCAYLSRCPKAITRCRTEPEPGLLALADAPPTQRAACFNPIYLDADEAEA